MKSLSIPRAVLVCRKRLELIEHENGLYSTTCNSAHECYGCNGKFSFYSDVHPNKIVEVAEHDSMEVIQPERVGEYWMTDEDVQSVLSRYPEDYYYARDLVCDLDTIIIYKEVKD